MRRLILLGKPGFECDEPSQNDRKSFEEALAEVQPWKLAVVGFVALNGPVSRIDIQKQYFGETDYKVDRKVGRRVESKLSKAISGCAIKLGLIDSESEIYRLAKGVTCDVLELLDDIENNRHESVRGKCVHPPIQFIKIKEPKPWVLAQRKKLELKLLESRISLVEHEVRQFHRGQAQQYLSEAEVFLDYLRGDNLNPSEKTELNRLEDRLKRVADKIQEFDTSTKIDNPRGLFSDVRVLGYLGQAISLFDHGEFEKGMGYLKKALRLPITLEDRVRVLALIAWIKLFTASQAIAWEALLTLQNELRENLSPRAQALVWIQTGRYYNRQQQFNDAEVAFAQADKLLLQIPQYEQECGAVAAGYGYIAQKRQLLDKAEEFYEQALKNFSAARWQWGIQVQYGNLAAVACQRYETGLLANSPKAHEHLVRAEEWCLRGLKFTEELGISGLTDLETTLVYIYRNQGEFVKAREWLEKSMVLAKSSKSRSEVGLIHAEAAELEEALGNRAKAINEYEIAKKHFYNAKATEWHSLVSKRLNELKINIAGKSLKIW